MSTLGSQFKRIRLERKLTQKQAAEAAGVSEIQYQNYEYDKNVPSAHVLIALADFYEISLDYLVGQSDNLNSMQNSIDLCARLKMVRIEKGLSQRETANRANVFIRLYQAYEDGTQTPSALAIMDLADALDVSLDYLMGRTDNPNSHK